MLSFILAFLLAAGNIYEMTEEEKQQTGIEKLSDSEKQALQNWLSKTTPSTPSSLHISEVVDNGRYVKLSDGSIWQIDPRDTDISSGWITPADITVIPSHDRNYPYTLVNSITQSQIQARKTYRLPPSPTPPPVKKVVEKKKN